MSVPASTSAAGGRLSATLVRCVRGSSSARSTLLLMRSSVCDEGVAGTEPTSVRRWFRKRVRARKPEPGPRGVLSSAGAARRPSGVKSSDAARDEVSAQAMLGQTTHAFASGIAPGNDLTEKINHLLVRTYP